MQPRTGQPAAVDKITEARVSALLGEGLRHQQAGRFTQAEQCYAQSLALDPEAAQALYQLGVLALQAARPEIAEPLLRRAIVRRNDLPEYHYVLGRACKCQNNLPTALESYRRAIELAPRQTEFHISLGIVQRELQQYGQAEASLRHALELQPDNIEALVNLGNVHQSRGDLREAVTHYEAVLALRPDHAEAGYNLARALAQQGDTEAAQTRYERLLEKHPGHERARFNLGLLYRQHREYRQAADQFHVLTISDAKRVDAWIIYGDMLLALHERPAQATDLDLANAVAAFRQVLLLDDRRTDAHSGLGRALFHSGALTDAETALQRAVDLAGDTDDLCTRLAQVRLALGDVPGASSWIERARIAAPGSPVVASSRLMLMNYSATDARELAVAHREFAALFAETPHEQPAEPCAIAPMRRLRIGYLSADLRNHSVAFFIEPVLEHHDHELYEIHCYHTDARQDAVTERLRGHVDHWRDCADLDDAALAECIQRDEIDILVELSGHSAGNRLGVMARRLAPVQASYLGYPGTTGLSTVDYRLTDLTTDPPGSEALSAEAPVRLPGGYFCYRPPADAPAPTDPPVLRNGFITFGSFNALYKLSDPLLDLWAELLRRLPTARLLLKARELASAEARERLSAQLQARGIDPVRLSLHHWETESADHLAFYGNVDIALDTFPYNGATTSVEALWMGVPVVSLCGAWPTARMGRSILTAIGLEELVADNVERYLATALDLARNTDSLVALHRSLRDRMRASPLLDAACFTRGLERAYRRMWTRWCDQHGS